MKLKNSAILLMAYAISMVSCISPDQEILEDDDQPWKVGDCILGNFFFVLILSYFDIFGGGKIAKLISLFEI